jgi:peptidoglycan/xylan/chitin deacetylase (PgdA/CDA1 family)
VLRKIATTAMRSRSFAWLVGLLERLDHERPDLLRVLTYHQVEWADADPPPYPRATVAPDAFAEQMRYVRERCSAVSIEQVLHALDHRGTLPPRAVLITFDDGYRDFRTQAWPVLKALRLPVALFVPTAFPGDSGRHFWWDSLHHALSRTSRRDALATPIGSLSLATGAEREEAFTRLRALVKGMPHADALVWVEDTCRALGVNPSAPALLSWDELRQLAREGVTMGSHTRTHPLLTQIPIEAVREELSGSRSDLERELGSVRPILAYPGGAFDERVVQIAGEQGLRLAFTTTRGINDLQRAHPLKLRRINVGRATSLALMRAQVLGRALAFNRFQSRTPDVPGAAAAG